MSGAWFGDEDHIDVRDVVEFATTGLSHCDHGEAKRHPTKLAAARNRQRGLQCVPGKVSQRGGDVLNAPLAGQIAPCDCDEFVTVGDAETRWIASGPVEDAGRPAEPVTGASACAPTESASR